MRWITVSMKKVLIFFGYITPAFAALYFVLPPYHERTQSIAAHIKAHAIAVQNSVAPGGMPEETRGMPEKERLLHEFFMRNLQNGEFDEVYKTIDSRISHIWLKYSVFITVMTLLPFMLLSFKIAFRSKRKDITFQDRVRSVAGDWGMKFLVAFSSATGWLYTVNPQGRGGSTLSEYINTQDVFTDTTLPGFLLAGNIPLFAAGFLGWYLNLVSYFISKLYYDDVYGTRVYRFLAGKLLFVYGVSLVVSSVELEQAKIALFFIGYFPLSALSMIKEAGIKIMQGGQREQGSLSELPGISRNQILRLHEEGIESVNALASHTKIVELKKYQYAIAPMVDYWVDLARLYSILGQKSLELREYCATASEFLNRYQEPEFRKKLAECGVQNPDEIARQICRLFSLKPQKEELSEASSSEAVLGAC